MKLRARVLGSALAFTACLSACSRPEPPRLTPRSSSISGTTAQGLGLRVQFDAQNNNSIALTLRSLDVKTTIAGQEQGRARLTQVTRLPAHQTTPLAIAITVPWSNLPGLIFSTSLTENVPYQVTGTARIGSESLSFDVPFTLNSTMPRSVLLSAMPSPFRR